MVRSFREDSGGEEEKWGPYEGHSYTPKLTSKGSVGFMRKTVNFFFVV